METNYKKKVFKEYFLQCSSIFKFVFHNKASLKVGKYCQLQIGIFHCHLPSTSTSIKSCAAAAADLQHPLKGVQGGEKK